MSIEAIKRLEGGRVSVALRGGRRLDDCHLISAPCGDRPTFWLFAGGTDLFVPAADVIDVWEAGCR